MANASTISADTETQTLDAVDAVDLAAAEATARFRETVLIVIATTFAMVGVALVSVLSAIG